MTRTTMRRAAVILTLAVAVATAQSTPTPAAIPLVGHWQLNINRTHYGPGVDRRRREQMSCAMEGARLQCVIRSARADGRDIVGRFAAAVDGTTAPVTGIPDVDAVQLRSTNRALLDATFLSRGKPVFGYRAFQSQDGRSLMVIAVDPDTRAAATTIVVYDRQ